MTKVALLAGLAMLFSSSAYAETNCLPSSPHPGNPELLKAIVCLQKALNDLPGNPTNPTDAEAVHYNDVVDLRFADQSWCIARGDPGDKGVYTIQCNPGAPGSGQSRITVDRHLP